MRYPIPASQHRVEEEIQKSRFITTIAPAATVVDAQAFIALMRAEFADATHNCWAYLVGPPGSSTFVGMSDDGEPHGTAGRPMLNVLSHADVGDLAVVVTRYYGGTKLGKGGLVRAYGGGVQLALESLPTKQKVAYIQGLLACDYAQIKTLKRLFEKCEIEVEDEAFAGDVTYTLAVPEDQSAAFEQELEQISNGQLQFEAIDT